MTTPLWSENGSRRTRGSSSLKITALSLLRQGDRTKGLGLTPATSGVFAKYAAQVTSASEGAVTQPDNN